MWTDQQTNRSISRTIQLKTAACPLRAKPDTSCDQDMNTELYILHMWVIFLPGVVWTALSHTRPLWEHRELHNHPSWPDVMIYPAPLSFSLHVYVPRRPVILSRIMWSECNGWCFQMFALCWSRQLDLCTGAFKSSAASFVCILTWGLNVRSEELESQPDSQGLCHTGLLCRTWLQ